MIKKVFMFISLVFSISLLYGCISSNDMINDMKERIPLAREFIEAHEKNLIVLLSIQNRLDGVIYTFSQDESIREYVYSEGLWGSLVTETSISHFEDLSETEVTAVTQILRSIDCDFTFIHICPEFTQILFMENNKGRHVTDFLIRNDDIHRLSLYSDYYVDQINQEWSISISYWQRG